MTFPVLSPKFRLSRRSPPNSADAASISSPLADDEAKKKMPPRKPMPRSSAPVYAWPDVNIVPRASSADDEAESTMFANRKIPRRRRPSSSDVKPLRSLSPIEPVPTSLEPSSAAPASSTMTPRSAVRAAAEPFSDEVSAVRTSSDPSSRDTLNLSNNVNLPTFVDVSREPVLTGYEANANLSTTFKMLRTPGQFIEAIRQQHRARNDLVRVEGDATRRIKSICMRVVGFSVFDTDKKRAAEKLKEATALYDALERGDDGGLYLAAVKATIYIRAGRAVATKGLRETEKELTRLAKSTHVASFVEKTPGFGYIGLSQIIGEAGDLALYANPAKLWKRMGLGLISSGERQRKFADAAKAIEAGYSPKRRSVMFVLGDSMLKKQGPYRDLYLARKAYEESKAPTLTKMAWHRRAQRYMEKRLLRNLWRVWNGHPIDQPDLVPN